MTKKEQPIPSFRGENKGEYIHGGPGPPSSPSDTAPSPTTSSLGALATPADNQRPTGESSRNSSTASVAFSFYSLLTAGALGCPHPQSFPTRLQSFRIWGSRARHSVKRWWRDSLLPLPHHPPTLTEL